MTARPAKRKVSGRPAGGGRVTPKGGHTREAQGDNPAASGRYTPPVPRAAKASPRWVPVLMFGLFGVGLAVIFLNYLGALPGAMHNGYLLVGLAAILGGIIAATQYR